MGCKWIFNSAGPDGGVGWSMAITGAFIYFIFLGLDRSVGIMYVETVNYYSVSRELAAWPYSLAASVFQSVGVVAGILAHRFGIRKTALMGGVVATIGMSSCFFADNVSLLTAFFGVAYATGHGITRTVVPVIVNQHFLRHKSSAMGLVFAGGTAGSLIFPNVIEFFIQTYGFKGSFLLLGGVVMNILVAAALLRKPSWSAVSLLTKDDGSAHRTNNNNQHHPVSLAGNGALDRTSHPQEDNPQCVFPYEDSPTTCQSHLEEFCSCLKVEKSAGEDIERVKILPEDSPVGIRVSPSHVSSTKDRQLNKDLAVVHNGTSLETNSLLTNLPKTQVVQQRTKHPLTGSLRIIIELLMSPVMIVISVSSVFFFFAVGTYNTIIYDYVVDKGTAPSDALTVIPALSLASLFGRMCLGWVTDKKLVSRRQFLIAGLLSTSVVLGSHPLGHSFASLMGMAVLYGILEGSTMIMFPLLLDEYCGGDKHAISFGMTCFFNSFLPLARPALLGYFRDDIGTYDGIFYILSGMCAVAGVIWFVIPCSPVSSRKDVDRKSRNPSDSEKGETCK